jgi:hypothetical protein
MTHVVPLEDVSDSVRANAAKRKPGEFVEFTLYVTNRGVTMKWSFGGKAIPSHKPGWMSALPCSRQLTLEVSYKKILREGWDYSSFDRDIR